MLSLRNEQILFFWRLLLWCNFLLQGFKKWPAKLLLIYRRWNHICISTEKNIHQVKKQVFSCITFSRVMDGHLKINTFLFHTGKIYWTYFWNFLPGHKKKHTRKLCSFAGGNWHFWWFFQIDTFTLIRRNKITFWQMKSCLQIMCLKHLLSVRPSENDSEKVSKQKDFSPT